MQVLLDLSLIVSTACWVILSWCVCSRVCVCARVLGRGCTRLGLCPFIWCEKSQASEWRESERERERERERDCWNGSRRWWSSKLNCCCSILCSSSGSWSPSWSSKLNSFRCSICSSYSEIETTRASSEPLVLRNRPNSPQRCSDMDIWTCVCETSGEVGNHRISFIILKLHTRRRTNTTNENTLCTTLGVRSSSVWASAKCVLGLCFSPVFSMSSVGFCTRDRSWNVFRNIEKWAMKEL